jgi:hypothetical protein
MRSIEGDAWAMPNRSRDQLSFPVQRQQFTDTVDLVIDDVGEDVTEMRHQIEAIKFSGFNQRVSRGCTVTEVSDLQK